MSSKVFIRISQILFTIWITPLFGQQHIDLQSEEDSAAINFATLFTENKVIGYVFEGQIHLSSPQAGHGIVHLWAMGFDTVSLRFPLKLDTALYLKRRQIILDEVEVRSSKCTEVISYGAIEGRVQKYLGGSLPIPYQRALRIHINGATHVGCIVARVSLFMPKKPERQQSTIRLRVYKERTDTALPGMDLLHTEILKQVVNDGRWYEIDLSEESISVRGTFYVGFESMPSATGQLPEFGIIVQKGPYETWYYHAEKNVWFQLAVGEDWKRMPNLAAKVQLDCPCRD